MNSIIIAHFVVPTVIFVGVLFYFFIGFCIATKSISLWSQIRSSADNQRFKALMLYPKSVLCDYRWDTYCMCMKLNLGYYTDNHTAGYDFFILHEKDLRGTIVYIVLHVLFWPIRLVWNAISLIFISAWIIICNVFVNTIKKDINPT